MVTTGPGNKWSVIVEELPGRTVSSVRNRWQRIVKGRERAAEKGNRCLRCGQKKRGHTCTAIDVVVENIVRVKRPRSPPLQLTETAWASAGSSLPPCDAEIPMTNLSVRPPPISDDPSNDDPSSDDPSSDRPPLTPDDRLCAPPVAGVTESWADVLPEAGSAEVEMELERVLDSKQQQTADGTPGMEPLDLMRAADSTPVPASPPQENLEETSLSLPQRPPEPPPPLVSRSYSTAQSILANLGEPGTTEAYSRSMSASNRLLNAREAVVDSMADMLNVNDENLCAALGLTKPTYQPAVPSTFHFSFGALPSPWA